MAITYLNDLEQGSDEWLAERCGLLTASEVKLILTPTFKIANNEKTQQHIYELAAQRLTGYVEPHYISEDMLRGMGDELIAKQLYLEKYAPVSNCGLIINDDHPFTLGYSPDGLVGDDGLIECKSRRQKYQVETIVTDEVPAEHVMQLQAGLLASGRKWIDYVSYCGGMPLFVKRVEPDEAIQAAIIEAATRFHEKLHEVIANFDINVKSNGFIATERIIQQEEIIV